MPFFHGRPGCKFLFEVVVSTVRSEQLLYLASLPVILLAISYLSLSEQLRRLS